MANEEKPTQRTPKGLEIPVPERKDFEELLDKVAKPKKSETPSDPKK